MTHEDKIIEELDKVLPDLWLDLEKDDVQEILKPTLYKEELWVESQLEISEDKLKDWLRQTLTTYRAQVLEEAQTAIFNAKPATKIRIPSFLTGKIATWELTNLEDINPTN